MECKFHKIPKYSELKAKLLMILSDNKRSSSFSYLGTKIDNQLGIMVNGCSPDGVRDFERFFSIKDIEHYFNRYRNKK